MKKTLLTLALAGLSATAFANVNVYQSNNALFYVNGSLYSEYTAAKLKATAANDDVTRNHRHIDYVRARLGFGGLYATEDSFRFGFDARWKVSGLKLWGSHTTYKTGEDNNVTVTKTYNLRGSRPFSWFKDGYNRLVQLDRFYVYSAHKDFGRLTLGRNIGSVPSQPTVSFEKGSYTKSNAGAVNLLKSFQNQAVYSSPLVEGVRAFYSFGNAHKGELGSANFDYTRNNAWGVQTTVADTTVTGVASWQKHYNAGNLAKKVNLFQANLANKSVKDLVVAATYTYEKARNYTNASLETPAEKTVYQTVALGTSYTVNQFVNPYAGVSFRYTKEFAADRTQTSRAKTVTGYVGLSSDLVKSQYGSVNLFVEGSASRTSKTDSAQAKTTTRELTGTAGATLSF